MPVSKDFLQSKMDEARKLAGEEPDSLKKQFLLGMVKAFYETYQELTKPPRTREQIINDEKNKEFDHDKIFKDIVEYYIDKKGYTVEHATSIAMQVVQEQLQKRMNQFIVDKDTVICRKCGKTQPSLNLNCVQCKVKLEESENVKN